MPENLTARFLFGALDRFRERMIGCVHKRFDVDIFSLTLSQQRLLRELALQTMPGSTGISLKALADELNLSSSAVSVMVEMLVQKKVLERRSSEVDRRQVLIRLSDAAWEAVEEFDNVCSTLFSGLTAEEQTLLKSITAKLSSGETTDK
jgi:DNA-binding MarR family transcriptional regulator